MSDDRESVRLLRLLRCGPITRAERLGTARRRIRPTETTVTTYDDFRTTAGRVDAWHQHRTDGHAENDRDLRIVSIAASGVSEADFAVPAPRRALVTFPAGVTSVRLPATLDEQQHFIVRVMVGSRGLDFILDTGSAGIVIDRAVASALGLKVDSLGSTAANAGRYSEGEAIVSDMRVGSLEMKDVAVRVLPSLSFTNRSGSVQVVGLLGFDFIASLALSLDYERGTVSAIDYDAFKPPSDPQSIAVPIRVGDQGPETDVTIDGRLGERFEIDTGGVGGVLIADEFTRRYRRDEWFSPDERTGPVARCRRRFYDRLLHDTGAAFGIVEL